MLELENYGVEISNVWFDTIGWVWVAVDMSCGLGRQKHVEPEVGYIALFQS
jgi:hypothetical protein